MTNEYERISKIKDIDLIITVEELSELIKAIQKLERYRIHDELLRDDIDDIIANLKEEIVDVKIVLDRLIDYVYDNDFEYYSHIVYKLTKLEEQINIY